MSRRHLSLEDVSGMEDDETAGAAGDVVGEAAARTLLLLPRARARIPSPRACQPCRAAQSALRRRQVCVVAGVVLLRECSVRLTP